MSPKLWQLIDLKVVIINNHRKKKAATNDLVMIWISFFRSLKIVSKLGEFVVYVTKQLFLIIFESN